MTPTRSLLIVDDVPEILQLFERLLRTFKAFPLEVVTEADPEAALALVGRREFDIVLSDFRMPRVDGIAVLRAARERNPNGRRVLMTGFNEIPATDAQIAAAGLSARLKKPVGGAFLIEFLQACFSDDPHALDRYQVVEAT